MLLKLYLTHERLSISYMLMQDVKRARRSIKEVAFIEKPLERLESVVKSFWTVLNHDVD